MLTSTTTTSRWDHGTAKAAQLSAITLRLCRLPTPGQSCTDSQTNLRGKTEWLRRLSATGAQPAETQAPADTPTPTQTPAPTAAQHSDWYRRSRTGRHQGIDPTLPGAENGAMKSIRGRPTGTGMASAVLLLCLAVLSALAACGGEQTSPTVATAVPGTPTA